MYSSLPYSHLGQTFLNSSVLILLNITICGLTACLVKLAEPSLFAHLLSSQMVWNSDTTFPKTFSRKETKKKTIKLVLPLFGRKWTLVV